MNNGRVSTGIPGADRLLGGGIPVGHSVLVLGPPGSGKTTFGLQFIWEGLRRGEKCLVLTMEESEEDLIHTASCYGWDFDRYTKVEEAARNRDWDEGVYAREKNLFVFRMDPSDLKGTVDLLKDHFPFFIRYFRVSRVMVDPLSVFELLFPDPAEKRQMLFQLAELVRRSGATAVYTAETSSTNPLATRDYMAEYAVAAFISLRYIITPEGILRYAFHPIKLRRSSHAKYAVEYEITNRGIVVHPDRKLDLMGRVRR